MTLRASVSHEKPKTADAKHFEQNITTADFSAPVLFAGVYEYDASELGFDGGGRIRVYYPPEAISAKDFIQSVFYSVLSVGTHEKNTREENADPDGFIRTASYDDKVKAVMAQGYIYGAKNVSYVADNQNKSKFGTSAFFRATYRPEKGTTPDGEEYDYIGGDLVCNHLAILENPRDDKNVVVITKVNRAVAQHSSIVRTLRNSIGGILKMADTEKPAVDKEEIRNALEEIKNEDAKANEISDLKNALAKMSDELAALKPKADAAPVEAANADDEADKDKDKDKAAEAAHGLPAQEIVKAYAKHYGRDFGRVTPSFAALAEIADIKADSVAEKARAVVAHAKALENDGEQVSEAAHEAPASISFAGFSKNI